MYIQVAKVKSVDEIDSAKLYKCTVDVGQGAIKHVMAGLKQHIAHEDLLGSLVVVITNLKPAKLAGNLSEVMVLAAQAQDSPQGEVVKVLQTPGANDAACLHDLFQLQRHKHVELQSWCKANAVYPQICVQQFNPSNIQLSTLMESADLITDAQALCTSVCPCWMQMLNICTF